MSYQLSVLGDARQAVAEQPPPELVGEFPGG
ncbi:hypothetical protein M2432_000231 [Mycobacterium sp. OTB74]|nr:hypothetical protein [Mycobacterium sp. OTB74]